MQTREQIYATKVYNLVHDKVKPLNKADQQKYGAMAHKLPILIRSAGLAQALAFVATRPDNIQKETFLNHLADVVGKSDKEMLLDASRTASISEYMLLTEHALAALLWFKRYAQSVLDVDAAVADDAHGEAGND
jgi:CRISPR-associated protein Cmr5